MIRIEIRFGQEDEDRGVTEVVSFDTKAEADAFMMGVELSNGWMSYEVQHDGREQHGD
jgi:hypothetical protein